MTSSGCFKWIKDVGELLEDEDALSGDWTHTVTLVGGVLRSVSEVQRKCDITSRRSNVWIHLYRLSERTRALIFSTSWKQKIYIFISMNCQIWYIALKTDSNCHILYLTTLIRYFPVHYRINFNNLIAFYIITIVNMNMETFLHCMALYVSLSVLNSPYRHALRILCSLIGVYSNHLEIFWKKKFIAR